MATDLDLYEALVNAALTDESLSPSEEDRLVLAAGVLARRPDRALAWGQVLTEHTAPPRPGRRSGVIQVQAVVEVHPFIETGGDCGQWLLNLDTYCDFPPDSPVHRVEELTNKRRDLLEDLLQTGPRIGVSTSLVDLGFAEHGSAGYVITPRGRAWLEAHPREGGERE